MSGHTDGIDPSSHTKSSREISTFIVTVVQFGQGSPTKAIDS